MMDWTAVRLRLDPAASLRSNYCRRGVRKGGLGSKSWRAAGSKGALTHAWLEAITCSLRKLVRARLRLTWGKGTAMLDIVDCCAPTNSDTAADLACRI